jgi:hypothetical protein
LAVFRRSNLVSKYKKPPAGFQKDYFHMKDRSQCATCHHVLEPTEADNKTINIETYAAEAAKIKAVVPSESTCYSCHRGITSYPFVHEPNFVWSCLTCHDAQAEPRYSVMRSKNKKGAARKTIMRRILLTNALYVTTRMHRKTLIGLTNPPGFCV